MAQSKPSVRALMITAKVTASAPRVLRELRALSQEGWEVDTVGFGETPRGSSHHYQLSHLTAFERYFSYVLPSNRWRFELSLGRRFRKLRSLELSDYDLIIFHEPSVFPLRELKKLSPSGRCRFHVDLHENHLSSLSRSLLEEIVFGRYRKWELRYLDAFASDFSNVATFSSCSPSIAALYSERWGCRVSTVRNAPRMADLTPSNVGSRIKLVHHGVGTRDRFHREYIEAISKSDGKFELHFYLVCSKRYKAGLIRYAKRLAVENRVFFHEPVPTMEISNAINKYDVGLTVIPPVTRNEEMALPNKLFESSQARLAIITGPNPDMASLVKENGNGLVLEDWSVSALVQCLSGLTSIQVASMKSRSHEKALEFSDERDIEVFREQLRRFG